MWNLEYRKQSHCETVPGSLLKIHRHCLFAAKRARVREKVQATARVGWGRSRRPRGGREEGIQATVRGGARGTDVHVCTIPREPAAQTYTIAPLRGSPRHRRIRLRRFAGARGADVYASTASRDPAAQTYTFPLRGPPRRRRIRFHRFMGARGTDVYVCTAHGSPRHTVCDRYPFL